MAAVPRRRSFLSHLAASTAAAGPSTLPVYRLIGFGLSTPNDMSIRISRIHAASALSMR
ncbi:twin-arginine translocation signal domain-containing protein [Streptosporangium saharense]